MSTVLATQVRKHTTARPTRAAGRYWKGKAPKGLTEVPSDSEEEKEQEEAQDERDIPIGGEEDIVDAEEEEEEEEEGSLPTRSTRAKSARALNVSLKDVSISQDGKVIVAGREESGRTLVEEGMSGNIHALLSTHQSCHAEESEEEEEEEAQAQVDEEEEEASFCKHVCGLWLTMLLSRARRSPSQKKKKNLNYTSDLYSSPSTLLLTRRSLSR